MAQHLVGQPDGAAGDHEPVPRRRAVGAGDAGLDGVGGASQRQRRTGAHQHHGAAVGGRRGEPPGGGLDVEPLRDLVGAARAGGDGVPLHPGQAEDPLVVAVEVEAQEIPAAGVAGDAPRLHPAPGRGDLAGAPVVELDLPPLEQGFQEQVEGRLVGGEPRERDVERRGVGVDAGRRQLAHRLRGGAGQPLVLPDPGGQADDGRLVRRQVHLGEVELVRPDPVARLVVEVGVDLPDGDRHTEAAELVLVALEHLLEAVRGGVGIDRLPDPRLGHGPRRHQQHDEQVHQPLGLRGAHRRVDSQGR